MWHRKTWFFLIMLSLSLMGILLHALLKPTPKQDFPLINKVLSRQQTSLEAPVASEKMMTPEDLDSARQIRAFFATGDYGRCLELAEQALSQTTRHSTFFLKWVQAQLGSILTALGWFKLNTGRCDQAITYLERAQKIQASLENAKGLSYCYYMNHSLEAAEEKILWYLEHNNQADPDVLAIYSEVLESKGRFAEAVKVLESLRSLNSTPSLEKKIAGMQEKAKRSGLFQTITTRFFSLTFEEEAHREIAEKTLEFLERALDELIDRFLIREPKKIIEVILYPEGAFKASNPNSPQWAEALFDGRIRVPLHIPYNLDHIRTVLRHELVHALLSQMVGARRLPSWFDEGVAQFASECDKGCIPFVFRPSSTAVFLREDLFQQPFTQVKTSQAHELYSQSLYLILTLIHAYPKGMENLHSIIENLRVDSPLDSDALLKQAGTSFKELRSKASYHWQRRHTSPAINER